jgi:hypothetical protein
MENRFRRFLAARRLSSTSSTGPNRSVDDLALYSVSYESTSPNGKVPVFIHQPLRNGTAARRTKDESDGLAIRAFSYDSTLAGKPPIMGGKPLKGNGPVKLQTSRRLSSGELLVTSQESECTLEDIREGEYIVGRKEKRLSRASQARSPTPSGGNTLSARLLSTGSASSLPHLPLARAISRSSMKRSFVVPSRMGAGPGPVSNPSSPHASSSLSQVHDDVAIISTSELSSTIPRSSGLKVSARSAERGSLLSQNEEQNASIQALWKAEYSRLVAIYGKDGVDRNILELNRDRRRSSSPIKNQATLEAMTALGMTLEPLPKPSFDSSSDLAMRRHSRLSSTKDTSSTEENSDYASTVRSSITSDGFPTSHAVRISGFEPDLPTTREDVRKVVEDMRSTYLRAIEAKGSESSRSKKVKKRRERASYSAAGHVPSKSLSKTHRPTRQSWHPSNTPAAPSPAISMERREQWTQPKNFQTIENSPTRPLQRADSMTLGSLMQSTPRKESSKKTSNSAKFYDSPPTPKATIESPADLIVQHQATYYNEHDVSEPEIAPDIDDFDIFYQDLYGPPPTASSMPSLPTRKHTSLQYPEPAAAPPPPDIEWAPRRRYVSQI